MEKSNKIEKKDIRVSNGAIAAIASLAVIITVYALFGFVGVKTIFFIALFFMLPAYLILMNFDLPFLEKIIFSFCIGLAFFPLIVWYINKAVSSLRTSTILAFVLVLIIGIIIKVVKKQEQ